MTGSKERRLFSTLALIAGILCLATPAAAVVIHFASGSFGVNPVGFDECGNPDDFCVVNTCTTAPVNNLYTEGDYEFREPGQDGNHYHRAPANPGWLAFHEGLTNLGQPEPLPGGDNLVKLSRIDGKRFDLIRFDEMGNDCDNPPVGVAGCGPPLIEWNNSETKVTGYRSGVPVYNTTIPADPGGAPGTITYVLNWTNLDYVIWDVEGNEWFGDGYITIIDTVEVQESAPFPVPAFGPSGLAAVAVLLMLAAAATLGIPLMATERRR